jgi:hypothetical protein
MMQVLRAVLMVLAVFLALVLSVDSADAITHVTTHDATASGLDSSIVVDDILSGLIPTELPGDNGWHPVNPASEDSMDPHGLPAFTDDAGFSAVTAQQEFYGLLNDFPEIGTPAKLLQYDLPRAYHLEKIQILSGNKNDPDGRVFTTTVVKYSTDYGANFEQLGYFQSDPSGLPSDENSTINSGQWSATLVEIVGDAQGALPSGVTNLQFDLYAVDNTQGEMRDPFDGVNPFTGHDDLLSAAFVAPIIYEIDVVGTSAALLGDVNLDGVVNGLDVDPFVGVLLNGPFQAEADMNEDGEVNGLDVDSFVAAVVGSDAAAVPEPSTLLLALLALGVVGGWRKWRG